MGVVCTQQQALRYGLLRFNPFRWVASTKNYVKDIDPWCRKPPANEYQTLPPNEPINHDNAQAQKQMIRPILQRRLLPITGQWMST